MADQEKDSEKKGRGIQADEDLPETKLLSEGLTPKRLLPMMSEMGAMMQYMLMTCMAIGFWIMRLM